MASSADNESAPVPPRPGASPETEIAPQLEDVLRNLNVNLEDELVRYRRQSHGRVPPPPPPRRAPQRQTLDLISVSASSSPSTPASETAPRGQAPTPPPPPPNPFLNQTAEPPGAEPLAEPIAPVEADLAEANEVTATDLPVPSSDTVPEGYLESSEELLKSIADQPTEAGPEPYSPERKSYGLLKLAGLIFVVLSGIGVGAAITYPSQLQSLRSRLWPTTTDDTTDETAASPETPDPSSETAAADPDTSDFDPPGPELSSREFVELDLESLSTLEVDGNNGSGAALPAPGQTAPAQQLPPPTAAPTPSGQPAQPAVGANNNGTTETPDAAGATAGAAEVSPGTTAAVTGSNFYVVTSYTGDASLNTARELVPDAFVRNFNAGARIQLAAFDNRAQAEDQVAFLTQQGAAVELFGPTNE